MSGAKWQYAARAAVMTMMASFGGGTFAVLYSMYRCNGKVDIFDLINGILGSLVSVTAGCFLYRAWDAIAVGVIGSCLTCLAMPLFDRLGIDDPVGATSAHGVAGIWGVIAVGFFADNPVPLATTNGRMGLFKGGDWYLLGVQCLAAFVQTVWGLLATYLLLWLINKVVPVRMDPNEELLGADLMEHHIRHGQIGISRALSALSPLHPEIQAARDVPRVGMNPGHEKYLDEIEIAAAALKLDQWRMVQDRQAQSTKVKRTGKSLFSEIFRPRKSSRKEEKALKNGSTVGRNKVAAKEGEKPKTSDDSGEPPMFAWID